MNAGLIIEYSFNGDETEWAAAVEDFIGHIKADESLAGKFSYRVFKGRKDPSLRVHMPSWADEATLAHVQGQEWFSTFAGKVKAFAGESLVTRPIADAFSTEG